MPLFLSINIRKSSPLFFLLQKMVPGEAQTRRYCLLCAALRVTWAPGGKWSCAATGVKSQPVLGAAECVVSPPGCALCSWLLFCLSRCALSEPVPCPSLLVVSPRSFSIIPASLGSQIAAQMGFLCLSRGGPGRPGSPGGLLASSLAS